MAWVLRLGQPAGRQKERVAAGALNVAAPSPILNVAERKRATRNELNVRAGSNLNQMKTSVQSRLNENDDVTILVARR